MFNGLQKASLDETMLYWVLLSCVLTLAACSAARRGPDVESPLGQVQVDPPSSVAALEPTPGATPADAEPEPAPAVAEPATNRAPPVGLARAAAAQPQTPRPPLPPLEPLVVTQLDNDQQVPDLDTTRLSLLMSEPVPIRDFLLLLVRDTSLSIVPDPTTAGTFMGELKDVTVRQALELALPPLGLEYAVESGVIRVFARQRETRIFEIDYVATERTVRRTLTTAPRDAATSGTIANLIDGGDLFQEVSEGVATLLSPGGRFALDRKAALLQVTDHAEQLERVDFYLDRVRTRMLRQVHVQAYLIEITLSDASAAGVDWAAALAEAGGRPRSAAQASVSAVGTLNGVGVDALVRVLSRQGPVRVLSSPSVVTLNNEPAVLSSSTRALASPTDPAPPVIAHVVLTVTPQVGNDGMVTMSVSPSVRARVESAVFPPAATAGTVQVRELDTLIRVRDGGTVALSGLIQTVPGDSVEGSPSRRTDLLILLTPTVLPSAS